MRIAVVGSGISGLSAAYLLAPGHDLVLHEKASYLGGHTNTVEVADGERQRAIDTGFIVHNPRNYPNLVRLFDRLGVEVQDTDMSFSVRCHRCRLEFSAYNLRSFFKQRRNLLSPRFLRLVLDGLRLVRRAAEFAESGELDNLTLGEFARRARFSKFFSDHLLIPLAAAIWSSGPGETEQIPARFCLRFFHNHGMLDRRNAPRWRTVVGGSRQYVRAIQSILGPRLQVQSAISRIRRSDDEVTLEDERGQTHTADAVVIATHADQALKLLADPTPEETRVLSSFRYSRNETILHTDASVLPQRRSLHSSWNYELEDCRTASRNVSVSYYMNRLQRMTADNHYCVSLNRTRPVKPSSVLKTIQYEHPIFNFEALSAQKQLPALNGVRKTWFCGAYAGNGFHEDGLVSALRVASDFGVTL